MRNWEIRYRLQPVGGKYFFRRVEAKYQHEANAIFDAEMPAATRCGSARPVCHVAKYDFETVVSRFTTTPTKKTTLNVSF